MCGSLTCILLPSVRNPRSTISHCVLSDRVAVPVLPTQFHGLHARGELLEPSDVDCGPTAWIHHAVKILSFDEFGQVQSAGCVGQMLRVGTVVIATVLFEVLHRVQIGYTDIHP